MLIAFLIVLISLFSFFVPKRMLKGYFVFSALFFSSLLLFYTPPVADDLYRYYELFDIINATSFRDFWTKTFTINDWQYYYLLNDFRQNSKVFILILYALKFIGIRQLLPFVFSLITYIPIFLLICQAGEDQKVSRQALCVCFSVIIACVSFRFVSCLRNMSAYALFTYFVYQDLVKGKNKVFCFLMYILLCSLHMSCVILLFARLFVMFRKKTFRIAILAVMLIGLLFYRQIAWILNELFFWSGYVTSLSHRIVDYYSKTSNYNVHGALFFLGSLFSCFVVYFSQRKKICLENHPLFDRVFIFLFAFTVGSIRQYDILTRNCELIAVLTTPYILSCVGQTGLDLHSLSISKFKGGRLLSECLSLVCCFGLWFFSLLFYTLFSYAPMQKGIVLLYLARLS